jgi:hypothetical protein
MAFGSDDSLPPMKDGSLWSSNPYEEERVTE